MLDTSHFVLGLLAILALVFANGFFVAAEFALVTVRKTRIDQLAPEGTSRRADRATRAQRARQLHRGDAARHHDGQPGTGLGRRTGAGGIDRAAFHYLGPYLALATAHSIAVIISFIVITALHIVLGELAPKTVALQYPEPVALLVAKPTELFMRVCWPFIRAAERPRPPGRAVVRTEAAERPSLVHSEEELKMLVTASQEAGVLEEDEEQMLHRVFAFADLTAGQIMVPRTEMVALPVDAPLQVVADTVGRGGHARLPVYREDLDDIVGVLHVTDLFRARDRRTAAVQIFRPSCERRSPCQKRCPPTICSSEMRQRHTAVAIVIDEFGGTAGMVTFSGLMERIVGEVRQRRGRHADHRAC